MPILYCGLGAYFAIQLIKMIWPVSMHAVTKMVLVLAASGGISAAIQRHDVTNLVVWALAGAGLAVLAHRFGRAASLAGDKAMADVVRGR